MAKSKGRRLPDDAGSRPHPDALFYHVARNALSEARSIAQNPKAEFRLAQVVASVYVFSALTLETFINAEYDRLKETRGLSVNESENTQTRWYQLPGRLGCPGFSRTAEPVLSFERLMEIRNKVLAHYAPEIERALDFYRIIKDADLASKMFDTVHAMIAELNRLTQERTELPRYLAGEEYLTTIIASFSVPIG
jgi:hypothetical protein